MEPTSPPSDAPKAAAPPKEPPKSPSNAPAKAPPKDQKIPQVSAKALLENTEPDNRPKRIHDLKNLQFMQCGSLEVECEWRVPGGMEGLAGDGEGGGGCPLGPSGQQRLAVLSYEQVRRLNDLMDEVVCVHGRGNFPTLEVKLKDLVNVVRSKLEADARSGGAGLKVRDIRLNGGAASHVLATESSPYNDLDLIFGVELSNGRNFDRVKTAVLSSLFDLLPEGVSRKRITTCSMKEAYVGKMVKVNHDGDRWSLISLGNSRGHRNVELKFVDSMKRPFEFSVDSFQIVLDSLLLFYDCSELAIGENFYPTVVGESVYGDFQEALYHLHKKLIATRHPEEIRGGGLLKYCNLLVRSYKPADPERIKNLERINPLESCKAYPLSEISARYYNHLALRGLKPQCNALLENVSSIPPTFCHDAIDLLLTTAVSFKYMCSRFFIDFPDIGQQRAKLENYLWNHFVGPEEESLKYQYLMVLHSVVEESTVCLMGHERRQTLCLIEDLACQVLCNEQCRYVPPTLIYAGGYYYAPILSPPCTCTSYMTVTS